MKLIHLKSPITGNSYCGEMQPHDILTSEDPPHNRDVPALCKMCRHRRGEYLLEKQRKVREVWANRPPRQKLHDWLVGVSRIGESDMAIIMDLMLIVGTCGLVLIPKHIAKWLLKAGV